MNLSSHADEHQNLGCQTNSGIILWNILINTKKLMLLGHKMNSFSTFFSAYKFTSKITLLGSKTNSRNTFVEH